MSPDNCAVISSLMQREFAELTENSVIAAVVRRNERYLVCQRPAHKRHGGLWEFPGGKIEKGETLHDAARRELSEELNLVVSSIGAVQFSAIDAASGFLIKFVEVDVSGDPVLIEHTDIRWLSVSELMQMPLAPSDRQFVSFLNEQAGQMDREAYQYAPYYCEENIWHLCQEADFSGFDRKVVLVSNDRRTCALWNQRAQMAHGEPVIWDYHVVLLFKSDGSQISDASQIGAGSLVSSGSQVSSGLQVRAGWLVYDLDTLLAVPIPIDQYIESTFGDPSLVPEEFSPRFRVIDADEFVNVFSSDRSHMLTADGRWQVEPPPWPAIVRNGKSNLMELIDMRNQSIGTVMDLSQFEACFRAGLKNQS